MDASEALALLRNELFDTAEPYLWSDDDLYRYTDDAQKMFCRLTDGISDATTAEIVDIAVSAGDTWLDLDPRILKIRGMTRTSDGREVRVINYEDMASESLRFDATTDTIQTVVIGMEENKLRLLRAAAEADALKLMVFRLPLDTVADGVDFEVGEQHHLELLTWAKHRAYLKPDTETYDKNKAEAFEGKFRAYCSDVLTEQRNKRHKIRSVRYGGI